ncbi:shikimate dehydrogenase [Psychrosphaera haliotis]|uniref:shikimate dehydrogenase n=1 Tax=Psychrosphaera haliotis TaxID=555083 RepID=UPI00236F2BE9|nr:shikimate dehydrogenase [Psychrosphaera haliotis]
MKKFLVIGNPIAHSKSPIIHEEFAKQLGIELTYSKQLLELDSFEEEVLKLFENGIAGANVTLPFKERAFSLCKHVTDRAKLSGAVNTLYIKDNTLCGDNTDGEGLVRDLVYNEVTIEDRRILVIGAGGATRGCIPALLNAKPKSIMIANRTKDKAQRIVDESNSEKLSALGLDEVTDSFDIVINATSSSVYKELPVVSSIIFSEAIAVYDMYYSNEQTSFLAWAEKINPDVTLINGLGMLVEQAAEAFYVWNGVMPKTQAVRNLLSNV